MRDPLFIILICIPHVPYITIISQHFASLAIPTFFYGFTVSLITIPFLLYPFILNSCLEKYTIKSLRTTGLILYSVSMLILAISMYIKVAWLLVIITIISRIIEGISLLLLFKIYASQKSVISQFSYLWSAGLSLSPLLAFFPEMLKFPSISYFVLAALPLLFLFCKNEHDQENLENLFPSRKLKAAFKLLTRQRTLIPIILSFTMAIISSTFFHPIVANYLLNLKISASEITLIYGFLLWSLSVSLQITKYCIRVINLKVMLNIAHFLLFIGLFLLGVKSIAHNSNQFMLTIIGFIIIGSSFGSILVVNYNYITSEIAGQKLQQAINEISLIWASLLYSLSTILGGLFHNFSLICLIFSLLNLIFAIILVILVILIAKYKHQNYQEVDDDMLSLLEGQPRFTDRNYSMKAQRESVPVSVNNE